jgi:hypothetical protein
VACQGVRREGPAVRPRAPVPEDRRTEVEAQIELGKLLALARSGRQPDSDVTVAELLDQYVLTAGWDVSTKEITLGYIRRTIRPSLGIKEVRRVRGPLSVSASTRSCAASASSPSSPSARRARTSPS